MAMKRRTRGTITSAARTKSSAASAITTCGRPMSAAIARRGLKLARRLICPGGLLRAVGRADGVDHDASCHVGESSSADPLKDGEHHHPSAAEPPSGEHILNHLADLLRVLLCKPLPHFSEEVRIEERPEVQGKRLGGPHRANDDQACANLRLRGCEEGPHAFSRLPLPALPRDPPR